MSALFHFFTKWQPLNNYEICFLLQLKSYFHSQDIQIFVFPTSTQFFPVSHCLEGWFKVNVKVYDVSNWLNKNLITHFVWYLKKEKRYDIEILSIDRVLSKEQFYGKMMQKLYTESESGTPYYFCLITQNSHCMQEIVLKIGYFERRLSETLKKFNFVFYFETNLF